MVIAVFNGELLSSLVDDATNGPIRGIPPECSNRSNSTPSVFHSSPLFSRAYFLAPPGGATVLRATPMRPAQPVIPRVTMH